MLCLFVGQRSPDAGAAASRSGAGTSQSLSPPQPAVRPDQPPQQNHSEVAAESGSLPSDWEVRSAPNGRPFFINHNTKTTTWVRK